MNTAALPPRIALELVDKALVLGRRHFWSLMRLALIPFLMGVVVTYLLMLPARSIAGRIAAQLVAYMCFGFMQAVTVAGAWDLLHGKPVDAGQVWLRVRRRAVGVPISFVVKMLLIVFGAVAFVLPGLYFLAICFVVPGVNVIEDLGILASFARSRTLARGSMPGVLLSTGAFWVVAVVISLAFSRALTALGAPPTSVIRPLVAISWGALVVPFQGALSAIVYLELRVRKEGYDLQHLFQSLSSAA